jgi:hypothetical protein
VTGIYPLNERIFNEDEFLSCYIPNQLYSQVTEPVTAPSSPKDNNERGTLVQSMKVTPEIIRSLLNAGPRKTGGSKHGRSWILTDTPGK